MRNAGGRVFERLREVKLGGKSRKGRIKVLEVFHSSGRANWIRMRK